MSHRRLGIAIGLVAAVVGGWLAFRAATGVPKVDNTTSTDPAGNEGANTVKDAPPNGPPTRKMSKRVYGVNETIVLGGGSGFLGNDSVNIYLVPDPAPLVSGTKLARADLRATVTTTADGDLPVTDLGTAAEGGYYIVLDYNGDGEYTNRLDAYTYIFVRASLDVPPTTVSVASSLNPAHRTQRVSLAATVAFTGPHTGHPQGQVAFYHESELLGVETLIDGVAKWTGEDTFPGSDPMIARFAGTERITAWYLGNGSSGELAQVVKPNPTTLTLTASAVSSHQYELVTFTAVVRPSGTPVTTTPTDNVYFYSGEDHIGTTRLDENGVAELLINWLERGTHTIVAVYRGGGVYDPSGEIVVHMVLNNTPDTGPDEVTLRVDTAATVRVLRTDFDPDADELTVTHVSRPSHGTATLKDDRVEYRPAAGFVGADSFTYTVEDGHGGSVTEAVTVRVVEAVARNRVFADTNGNGIEDSGERGIPMVLVTWYDAAGKVVATTLTDDNGFFRPPGRQDGRHGMRFGLPPGMERVAFSPKHRGAGRTLDSDVNTGGTIGLFTYDPQQGWPGFSAGAVLDPTDQAYAYWFE